MRIPVSLLIISVVTLSARAQNYEQNNDQSSGRYYQSSRGSDDPSSQYGQRNYNRSQTSSNSSQVKRLNRASNLIGAEVRDQQNEKVGEVKDVVIDFNSGRVAYVVVDANDLLESDQSLIAVPARVIHVSRDQQTVKVDARRERLKQMRTFSGNNYPPIRSRASQSSQYSQNSPGNSEMSSMQNRSGYGYSQRFSDNSDRQNRYSSGYPGQYSQSRYGQSRNNGGDDDWYYYEWYLVPDGNSRSSASSYENGNRWNENRESSEGAYGEAQTGSYGRAYGENGQNYRDNNENGNSSSQFQSSHQGMPSSDSSWLAYNRYQEHHENGTANENAESESNGQRQANEQWEEPPRSQNNYASHNFQSYGAGSRARNEMPGSHTAPPNSQALSGYVRDVDYSNQTFTVEGQDKTLTFKLADNPSIKINGRGHGSFSQLHQGQRVEVGYSYRDGANRAFTINERSRGSQSASASGSAQSSESSSESSRNSSQDQP